MKIYDTMSHRSYEVNPSDININKTKSVDFTYCPGKHIIFVHKNTKYDISSPKYGAFYVSKKTYKKIVNTPRKSW